MKLRLNYIYILKFIENKKINSELIHKILKDLILLWLALEISKKTNNTFIRLTMII